MKHGRGRGNLRGENRIGGRVVVETNGACGEKGCEGEGKRRGCKIGGGEGELGEVEEIGKSSG